jgi:hypothetical protein
VTDFVVAPPALNTWDTQVIGDAALAVLRMDTADVDAGRVYAAAGDATMRIDYELDEPAPIDVMSDPWLLSVAVTETVAIYRDKDAATGMNVSFTPDRFEPVGGDPMARVRKSLVKRKARFGCG